MTTEFRSNEAVQAAGELLPEEGLPVNRRGFLAGLAVALGGVAAGHEGGAAGRSSTAVKSSTAVEGGALLTAGDLLTPGGGSYVEWRVDSERSPLLSHLARVVPGFGADQAEQATVGFVGRAVSGAPRYVEAALVDVGSAASVATAVNAVAAWFEQAHPGQSVTVDHAAGVVEWTTTDGGDADVLRVESPRAGTLLFVAAAGPAETALSPEQAVRRYVQTIRSRL